MPESGYRARRQQGRCGEQHPLRPRDIDADRASDAGAEPQRVERRYRGEREREPGHVVGRGREQRVPPSTGERAGEPREDLLGAPRLEPGQDERDDRREQRRQRNAGEDQSFRVESAAAARQRGDEQRRPQPRDEPEAGTSAALAPSATPIAIAAPAPALTPVRNGSTSGLRSIPWSRKPAIASATPTNAAMQTRGKRSVQTIAATSPPACGWNSAARDLAERDAARRRRRRRRRAPR